MKVGFSIDDIRRVKPYRISLTPQDVVSQVRPGLGAVLTRGRRTSTGVEYPIIDLPAAGQLNGWFDSTVKWIGTAATNTWNWITGKPSLDYEDVSGGPVYTSPYGKTYQVTQSIADQYAAKVSASGKNVADGWMDRLISDQGITPIATAPLISTIPIATTPAAPGVSASGVTTAPGGTTGRTTIPATPGPGGTNVLPQIMGYLAWMTLPADQKANYRYDPTKGVAEYIGAMSATDVSGNIGNIGGGAVIPASGVELILNQWMPWILAIAGGLVLISMTRGAARE